MDDGLHARIESIRIRGFRSLADVQVTDLPPVAVLIGANGSGKSNVMRFIPDALSDHAPALCRPVCWPEMLFGTSRVRFVPHADG